jgi:hypothetical protein
MKFQGLPAPRGTDLQFGNAGDGKGSGSMTVQEATFNSVNTYVVSRPGRHNLVWPASSAFASPPRPETAEEAMWRLD